MSHAVSYHEIIDSSDIRVPFVPEIVTPAIEKPLRNGRYEKGEVSALDDFLRPGDRVLDLGAGLGLLSAKAAGIVGGGAVTAVEANPALIPMIRETWRLNGVSGATLLNGIVAPEAGDPAGFYIRRDFWASSVEPDSRPFERVVKIARYGIGDLIRSARPTVILCDIEGAELDLFEQADLSDVRALVVETHPKVYGEDATREFCRALDSRGLRLLPIDKPSTVRTFLRPDPAAPPIDGPRPRVLIASCMKNEGPFILEWLAWHKAIGVTDFVIFTNDCSDGTDLILDRLQDMGELRHLPNPALANGSTYFQPAALALTPHLLEYRRADYFISMDVDEFINIRAGKGQLSDLFDAVGPFDALSMSELNHGSNRQMSFEPGLVTEQFPRHESETPGKRKASRGVKTIVRLGPKLDRPRNHRPDFKGLAEDVHWIDGAGRPRAEFLEDESRNGFDARGTYDLVVLEHYPLRSLESYLAKMDRGDVVIEGKQVSTRYWRVRNRNEELTTDLSRQQPAFRAELERLMADDLLMELHEDACLRHARRVADLLDDPAYQERKSWIIENAW